MTCLICRIPDFVKPKNELIKAHKCITWGCFLAIGKLRLAAAGGYSARQGRVLRRVRCGIRLRQACGGQGVMY